MQAAFARMYGIDYERQRRWRGRLEGPAEETAIELGS